MYKYAAAFAAGLAVGWVYNGSLWSAKHERLIGEYAQAVAEGQERTRQVEQDWAAAMIEVQKDARKSKDALEVDLGDARAIAGRLRERIRVYTDRPAKDTTTSNGDNPSCPTERVLAQLLERTDELAGIYAGYADELKIAGSSCSKYASALMEIQAAPR